jgi:protein-tyrosine phosphatase
MNTADDVETTKPPYDDCDDYDDGACHPDPRRTPSLRDEKANSKLAMAVKVFHNTYLGDGRAARSDNFFEKANIAAVLNMTPNHPNTFREKNHIEYLRIPVYDSHGKRDVNKMYQYFPLVTEFMYKSSVMEGKNILVHCALGRQRSCAAIAAYLIRFYHMTPMEAMNFIIKKKPDAFHWGASANFAKALNRWYYKLYPYS